MNKKGIAKGDPSLCHRFHERNSVRNKSIFTSLVSKHGIKMKASVPYKVVTREHLFAFQINTTVRQKLFEKISQNVHEHTTKLESGH